LGEQSSVWPSAVIRGDDNTIAIGDNTNVQDGAVLHVDPGYPMSVGANVTVGHQAMLHGCTIGDGSPVGIQAIVYNKAVIGRTVDRSRRGRDRRQSLPGPLAHRGSTGEAAPAIDGRGPWRYAG